MLLSLQGEVGEHGQKGAKGGKGEHVSPSAALSRGSRGVGGSDPVLIVFVLRTGSSWTTRTYGPRGPTWFRCK